MLFLPSRTIIASFRWRSKTSCWNLFTVCSRCREAAGGGKKSGRECPEHLSRILRLNLMDCSRSRSPSPQPSPQGEGKSWPRLFESNRRCKNGRPCAPSPWGESWGEGDRRVRQPGTFVGRTARTPGRWRDLSRARHSPSLGLRQAPGAFHVVGRSPFRKLDLGLHFWAGVRNSMHLSAQYTSGCARNKMGGLNI